MSQRKRRNSPIQPTERRARVKTRRGVLKKRRRDLRKKSLQVKMMMTLTKSIRVQKG
jgi:hypothetical protein